MKIRTLFALLFTLFITVQCKSSQELASLEQAGDRAAFSEYPQFSERFDLKDYSGTTFLNFMKVSYFHYEYRIQLKAKDAVASNEERVYYLHKMKL